MKKLNRVTSILLSLLMLFTISASSFAQSTNPMNERLPKNIQTVYNEDGNEMYLTSIVTNQFSRATLIDVKGNVIADYTYYFNKGIIYDSKNNTMINLREKHSVKEIYDELNLLADDIDYKYVGTTSGSMKVAGYTTLIIATMIAALIPGASWTAVWSLASAIAADAIGDLYYIMDLYMASDSEYDYVKRVVTFYSDDDYEDEIGTIIGYQKKSNQI